eukprot:339967-Pelagomonas_calceolata.AAC.1
MREQRSTSQSGSPTTRNTFSLKQILRERAPRMDTSQQELAEQSGQNTLSEARVPAAPHLPNH